MDNKIFVDVFLTEGYEYAALRKGLPISPFVERFNTATLGNSYWYILPVIRTISLNIAFLPIFCW